MSQGLIGVVNAGSSSLKFSVYAGDDCLLNGQVDGIGVRPAAKAKTGTGETLPPPDLSTTPPKTPGDALIALLPWLQDWLAGRTLAAIGHRVVHGGPKYAAPARVTPGLVEELKAFIPLAPLHQPHNLSPILAALERNPGLPQVACFDTAFHRTQPTLAQLFALPRRITAEGVRRYGFHGLSYEYIAETLPQHLGARAEGRVVVAHLGNGASLCGLHQRRSVATSMGFTALDGLMMGTRTGSLDPGVLLYLMERHHMDARALEDLLYRQSGLLGVSGISQDMRELLASGEREAREAVDLFCYRLVREAGALAAVLGGIDALVFTGGIGEHAAPVRARACKALAWLGLDLDEAANEAGATVISRPSSAIAALVVPTNEEWMIARHTARLAPSSPHRKEQHERATARST
jgi:acetate kinase